MKLRKGVKLINLSNYKYMIEIIILFLFMILNFKNKNNIENIKFGKYFDSKFIKSAKKNLIKNNDYLSEILNNTQIKVKNMIDISQQLKNKKFMMIY